MRTCSNIKKILIKLILLIVITSLFIFGVKNNVFAVPACGDECQSNIDCQGATSGCTECRDVSFYTSEWTGPIYKTCQKPSIYEERHEQITDIAKPLSEKADITIKIPNLFSSDVCKISDCEREALNKRTTRPAKGDLCDKNPPLTSSCATSFDVYDEVYYLKSDPQRIEKQWQEEITIDPTKITIPFVGMEERDLSSEADYITDYLEGTNEYYRNYNDTSTITEYQGVLRKLTPFEYQNQLKKELAQRVNEESEGKIHDYHVQYKGRICWDFPVWLDFANEFLRKFTSFLLIPFPGNLENRLDKMAEIDHFCIYSNEDASLITKTIVGLFSEFESLEKSLEGLSEIPGVIHVEISEEESARISEILDHFPPDPNEENYEEEFKIWKNKDSGRWYRLWQAMPMLSREDSQGKIEPYLHAENEEDKITPEGEELEEMLVEGVPHLARLYEASKEVNHILIPAGKDIEMYVSEENLEGECFEENYIIADKNKSDNLCCQPILINLTAQEEFDNPYYPCQEATGSSCLEQVTKDVSRGFGMSLKHPYLDEIWSYTANANGGFFNIFRPYQISPFEDIPAADIISYSASPGEISPEEGIFYFPHLGGIQKAKEWVVNEALRPLVTN